MTSSDDPLERFRRFLVEPAVSPVEDLAAPPALFIGKYRIKREIARGGMGVVYEAEDPDLKRSVALKVLRESDGGAHEVSRLHREASIAARLRHPNLVAIHEVGTAQRGEGPPMHFIAMDYVEGRTFGAVIADRSVDLRSRLRMILDTARAVAYAHRSGVIHRDLKPANVLVDQEGRIFLTDFGLARAEAFQTRLTQDQAIMGTPQYMAPEQIEGRTRQVDARTDVYALGVMLYEALAGQLPFAGHTIAELYWRIIEEDPRPPSSVDADLDRELDVICLKAMEKNPARRYASAEAFAEDVDRHLRGEPILASAPSLFYRIRKKVVRWRVPLGILGGSVTVLIVLGVLFVPRWMKTRRERSEARARVVVELQRRTRELLDAALRLRRAGDVAGMKEYGLRTEEACREAIREVPDRPEPHYALGRMYRALMKDDWAIGEQGRALEKDPDFSPARYERIVLNVRRYGRGGKKDPALPGLIRDDLGALLRSRRTGVREAERLCAEGLHRWAASDVPEAREALLRTVRMDPTLEEAYEALAMLETEAGDLKKALDWWTRGHEADKGYLPHLEGRGTCAFNLGVRAGGDSTAWYRAAIKDFSEVLKKDPGRSGAWMARGLARLNWGAQRQDRRQDPAEQYAAALRDFGEAVKRNPDRLQAWVGRARVLRNLAETDPANAVGNLFAAERDYEEAIRRSLDKVSLWISRAEVRFDLGRALEREGKDPEKQYEGAFEDAGQVAGAAPKMKRGWELRGLIGLKWALYLHGKRKDPVARYRRAISDFTVAVKGSPADGDLLWLRAEAYENLGRYHRAQGGPARSNYRAALDDYVKLRAKGPSADERIEEAIRNCRRVLRELGE